MEERKSYHEAPSLMGLGEAEFESAYREYRNLVLYILASILHDKEDIEDACQETFLSFEAPARSIPQRPSSPRSPGARPSTSSARGKTRRA